MASTTHFKGNLDVAGNLTVGSGTNPGTFKVPSITQAQRLALTPSVGMIVYDSTNGAIFVYQSTGWARTDGTAAGSLQAAYTGGATMTVTSPFAISSSTDGASFTVTNNSATTT